MYSVTDSVAKMERERDQLELSLELNRLRNQDARYVALEKRIAALEAAVKPGDNQTLIDALKQADDAIQKVIAHFRDTAAKHHDPKNQY